MDNLENQQEAESKVLTLKTELDEVAARDKGMGVKEIPVMGGAPLGHISSDNSLSYALVTYMAIVKFAAEANTIVETKNVFAEYQKNFSAEINNNQENYREAAKKALHDATDNSVIGIEREIKRIINSAISDFQPTNPTSFATTPSNELFENIAPKIREAIEAYRENNILLMEFTFSANLEKKQESAPAEVVAKVEPKQPLKDNIAKTASTVKNTIVNFFKLVFSLLIVGAMALIAMKIMGQ